MTFASSPSIPNSNPRTLRGASRTDWSTPFGQRFVVSYPWFELASVSGRKIIDHDFVPIHLHVAFRDVRLDESRSPFTKTFARQRPLQPYLVSPSGTEYGRDRLP